jgi:inhibitor of KinA
VRSISTIGVTGARTYRPVGGDALLVELGEEVDDAVHARVVALDAALCAALPVGLVESVPAYTSLLARFDPLVTDHKAVAETIDRIDATTYPAAAPAEHCVPACYDRDLAPDLAVAAEAAGLDVERFIAAHLDGAYRVNFYGFAPGYAYLAGVPQPIQLPRKPAIVRDVPAGSILIAGPQCLVTSLAMPTGWWIIGRAPRALVDPASEQPFPFAIGDRLRFVRADRAEVIDR